ncbi:hypothetical protein ACJX0J_028959, partial [Zea mays]
SDFEEIVLLAQMMQDLVAQALGMQLTYLHNGSLSQEQIASELGRLVSTKWNWEIWVLHSDSRLSEDNGSSKQNFGTLKADKQNLLEKFVLFVKMKGVFWNSQGVFPLLRFRKQEKLLVAFEKNKDNFDQRTGVMTILEGIFQLKNGEQIIEGDANLKKHITNYYKGFRILSILLESD